jgi:hypothetical protein
MQTWRSGKGTWIQLLRYSGQDEFADSFPIYANALHSRFLQALTELTEDGVIKQCS